MNNLSKDLADRFIEGLTSRPHDFMQIDQYELYDTFLGVSWWVANGAAFFGMYRPVETISPTFFEWAFASFNQRGRCWRAYQKWSASKALCEHDLSFSRKAAKEGAK